jgi:hypothetical protein
VFSVFHCNHLWLTQSGMVGSVISEGSPRSRMSSTNAQGYSSFYQHLAVSPELGIFRRFGAYWAKKVHDETSDLSTCLAVLNLELAKWPDLQAQTILDCPKRLMMEKCPKDTAGGKYLHLHEAWDRFDKALMVYGMSRHTSVRSMLTCLRRDVVYERAHHEHAYTG